MVRGRAEAARERERIAARIRALLSKTVANGCTEQEALSAAQIAADMLARHDIEMDEVEIRASPFARESSVHEDEVAERLWKPADAIQELTSARYWRVELSNGAYRYEFLGFAHEAQIAGYLLDICARAMRDELARASRGFVLYRPEVRVRRRAGFLDGMADSLHRRILAMRPPRVAGTGLVPLRESLIDEEMERLGIKLGNFRARMSRDFEASYAAGVEAGNRVGLDPGLRASAPAASLISRPRNGTA